MPYLETDDSIDAIVNQWSAEWHTTIDLAVGGSKSSTHKKKEETKLKMTQMDKRRKTEANDKA